FRKFTVCQFQDWGIFCHEDLLNFLEITIKRLRGTKVTVHGYRFTVHIFSMNYATMEAFWILTSTLQSILSHLNQKMSIFFNRKPVTVNRERLRKAMRHQ
ncbi:MAG: hypothetical protein Q8P24_04700, partial [Desulfobacterales bacterium]|nr:hypothetical protein [Desulfobacterales bacterium]